MNKHRCSPSSTHEGALIADLIESIVWTSKEISGEEIEQLFEELFNRSILLLKYGKFWKASVEKRYITNAKSWFLQLAADYLQSC